MRKLPKQADFNNTEDAISRWSDTIWRLVMARLRNESDASDAFQDTFLALCRSKPDFKSLEHQKAWLLRTACNSCNQILRKRTSRPTESIDSVDVVAPHSSPSSNLELEEMLGRLTDAQRTVVHLFYFEGYSTDDIAGITGEKPATVRSHLHRARQALRLELTERNGGERC